MIEEISYYKARKIDDDQFKIEITQKINEIISKVNQTQLGIKSKNHMAYPCGCVWFWHQSELNWFVDWCKTHEVLKD